MAVISPHSLLSEILEYRAKAQPEQVAYTFFQNGIKIKIQLTYQELDNKAKAIASSVQSLTGKGNRVLLLYPQGLEFIEAFFGCLNAGVIAVPAPAPDTIHVKRYLPRLISIVEDCQAKLILTTTAIKAQLEKMQVGHDGLLTLPLFTTDVPLERSVKEWVKPELNFNHIAYLQYTSGSTSIPKGVIITHGNVIQNLKDMEQSFYRTQEAPSIVNWVPHIHDLGLVKGLLLPLYAGIPCYLLSPLSFLRYPIYWLKIISDYKVTYTHAPNFAYQYCVAHITPKQREGLDLSHWVEATITAEPIRHETVEAFINTFKPYGFNSSAFCLGYGLAEATLFCTAIKSTEEPYFESICAKALSENKIIKTSSLVNNQVVPKCGFPSPYTKIVIAHPTNLTTCSFNEVGEIWLTGGSIGRGYWNRDKETQETFRAYLKDTQEGPFLRTGDLGFIQDGELFVTGRLKDLIIVRGKNYYPQDIEWAVEKAHQQIRSNSCAAFSVDVEGVEQLVIVTEIKSNKNTNPNEIIGQIRQVIATEQELSVYAISLIKKGTIPKTSSGKIQRSACLNQFINNTLKTIATDILNQQSENLQPIKSHKKIDSNEQFSSDRQIIPPKNEVEKMLLGIWKRVFEIKDSYPISVTDNFFAMGGDSIKAVAFIKDVEATFSQEIPLSAFVEYPSIEQLARLIRLPQWSNHYQNKKIQSLVPLKPDGNKKPFFYIHPASGSVLPFGNLARRFDRDRPLYGLQAVGIDGVETPLTSIEAMASNYLKQIKIIQPQGPYLIGGRCLGGITAFEIAQQLLARGEKVNGLIMIEAPYQRKRMIGFLVRKNQGKLTSSDRNFEQTEQIKNIGKIDSSKANHFDRLLKIHLKNAINYRPKMYDGQIDYFYAKEDSLAQSSSQLAIGWDKFTELEVNLRAIDGSHRTIDYEPNVQILAGELCNLLDKLDA